MTAAKTGVSRSARAGLVVIALMVVLSVVALPAIALAAPVTALTGVPAGWTRNNVQFTLTPDLADTTSYYILGDGLQQTYTDPVTVSVEGATLLQYWSVKPNCDDPIETTKQAWIRIDRTAPVSSIAGLPPQGDSPAPFTFIISATDALSGVAATTYQVDGGPQLPYTAPVLVTPSGPTAITYWSTDAAGNVESAQTAVVTVNDGLPRTAISGVPAQWTRSDVTFALTATASQSSGLPVAGTYYALGSGPVVPYVSQVTVSGEGATSVSYFSVDSAGGRETTRTQTVRIDKTAPVSSASGIPSGASHTPVTFTLSSADTHSGVSTVKYRLDGGSALTYSGPVTVSAEGNTALTYWAVDAAGNTEATHSATIEIDTAVPSTTIAGLPGGWTNANVTFSLAATIVSPLSTVSATYYSLGGADTPYSGPVTVSQEGDTAISYYSVSSTGNREGAHGAHVYIDKTAPGSDVSGIPAGVSPNAVTFSLGASDALSGVSAIRYQLNGGAADAYSGPVTVSAEGSTTLSYWSVDAAGNSETPHTAQIQIAYPPAGPPVTAASGIPVGWSSRDVTVTLAATSPGHTVTGTFYRIGSGADMTYAAPIVIGAQGVTTLTYWSTDDVGGREADKSVQIRVDKAAPSSTASGLPSEGVTVTAPVVFSLSASDALSGVAAIRYQLGSGPVVDYATPVTVTAQGATQLLWWAVDVAGNSETRHAATIRIGTPPAQDVPTSVTIRTNVTSCTSGKTATLSGAVTPASTVGRITVVYVQKPGSGRWTYSSNRVVYSLAGGAAWQYKYVFKAGMAKGVYRYKAVFPAVPGFLGSTSPTAISVRLR